ncbi:MAG: NAD(P)-dependent oxidoreductase [Candidatus Thorarchaeota archaeon]|nr:NAD(P)-dependent oxidoreductase [Candidatus Thorarchaeota archaeon]
MVRCFITGATGFVGSHIVNQLNIRDHDVSILARNSSSFNLLEGMNYSVVTGDVTNMESLKQGIPDDTEWLFHNAAIMAEWGSKKRFFSVNVEGTRNILEIARLKEIPNLIFTSSTAVYGFPNKRTPLNENDEWKPMNNYQKSKAESEKLVRQYIRDQGMKAAMVRAPTVLGRGDMYTGPQMIEFLKGGRMVTFRRGENPQSYCHGEDFARCLVLCAENMDKAADNAYNVASFDCTFKEFLDALADELGAEKNYRNFPYTVSVCLGSMMSGLYKAFNRKNAPLLTAFRVKLFGTKYLIDISKAKEEIGYTPKWDLISTVKDIVEWGGTVKPR